MIRRRPRWYSRRGLAVVLAGGLPAGAHATNATGSAGIGATVVASCSLSATTLNFGTYVGAQLDATSTITVTCTNTTSYNIGVDHGIHSGFAQSYVLGPNAALVPYRLYQDAARTNEWSVTIGTNTVSGTGTGSAQVLTVYGRASAGTLVAPGTYSDTVTATVTY